MHLPVSSKITANRATFLSAHSMLLCWIMTIAMVVGGIVAAEAETRTLRLYFTHTKESATITFKKNGKYIPSGLKKLNRILRDFRRNEPTKMDPKLFDVVWEVYKKSGSRKPIHVISGYRSPRTNSMLRRRGRKVAKNSQHMRGKALDFFLPDVSVSKLRALGLKAHGGGVGYYRGSFVHLDTGRVRHWPRMSSRQLAKVFPRGRTIHVPSNGKRLRGYKVAAVNLKAGLTYDGRRRGGSSSGGSLLASVIKRVTGADEKDVATNQTGKKPSKPIAPKPAAETVAVAEKPAVKKPSGPDPFSLEIAAAKKQQREQDLVLAAAEAIQPDVPDENGLNWPTKIGVPKPRPAEAIPQLVAVAELNAGSSLAQTVARKKVELALAPLVTEPDLADILRPSVDIPDVEPAPARFSVEQTDNIGALKDRIILALNRQRRKSVVEKALEAQAGLRSGSVVAIPTVRQAWRPDYKPVLKASLDPTEIIEIGRAHV